MPHETQIANIERKTGRPLADLLAAVHGYGGLRHGQIVAKLKEDLGLGHGDANLLAHLAKPAAGDAAPDYYTGGKEHLRPIHDRLLAALAAFGPFEIAPKKTYVSLRRQKQFAMVGPATKSRVEVGLNMKGVPATGRLEALPPGGMCQYRVRLGAAEEVDAELLAWLKIAYDHAG